MEYLQEIKSYPFDCLVLDEATSFKSYSSKRFKALKRMQTMPAHVIELTGTPAPNGPMDLWAQMYLLDGGKRLGRTISGYREQFFEPDKRNGYQVFSYRPKTGAEDAIYKRLSDICISMSAEDYLTLPDLIVEDIPVALSEAGRKAYRSLEREMLLEIQGQIITAPMAAAVVNKLLQLCCGDIYDGNKDSHSVHKDKYEAFSNLLDSLSGEPVLVFYSFTSSLPGLMEILSKRGLRWSVLRDSANADAWNNGEYDVLLAHPASSAYGLNLQTGGRHIIWFGLPWSLELYQQAIKRLHRQGQVKPVIVHRLIVQDSVDCDVVKALERKDGAQNELLEAIKSRAAEI
jgi:SNF2 family DNA or RNA helicase